MSNDPNSPLRKFETGRVSTQTPVNTGVFSVIGKFSDEDQLENFVEHAALNDAAVEVRSGQMVSVFHMCPPLAAASVPNTPEGYDKLRADLIADVSLQQGEINAMKSWRAEIEKLKRNFVIAQDLLPFREYIVQPYKESVKSEKGRFLYWRFSCAGLVIDCYASADIQIIDTDSEMPEIDEALLKECYSQIARLQQVYEKRPDHPHLIANGFRGIAELGLREKPWRPILVGYLFHSLKRYDNVTPRPAPYIPKSVDERYVTG